MPNKRLKIAVFLLILAFCAMFALRANRTTDISPEQQMRNAHREIIEAKTEEGAEKTIEKMGDALEEMLEEKKASQKPD